MPESINDIKIFWDAETEKIHVTIELEEKTNISFTRSIIRGGIFKFTINHPISGNKCQYFGVLNKDFPEKLIDVVIYPIYGDDVLSKQPIPITEK